MASSLTIDKRDESGEAVNVCTKYDVHTISLVDKNALGINILKVKSENVPNEEDNTLTDKINKAKALDADIASKDEVLAEVSQEEVAQVKAKQDDVLEPAEVSEEVIEKAKAEDLEVEAPVEAEVSKDGHSDEKECDCKGEDDCDCDKPVDKTKAEDVVVEAPVEIEVAKAEDAPVEEIAVEEVAVEADVSKAEEVVVEDVVEVDSAKALKLQAEVVTELVEKEKALVVDQLGDSFKLALEAMSTAHKAIMSANPDADQYEVYSLLQGALDTVDYQTWNTKDLEMSKLFDEVYDEVAARTTKAKSLKVQEATSPTDAMKAFELANPEMAKLLKVQLAEVEDAKSKALADKEEVIRQKAYDQGASQFKRIATDDNTTNQIVDALADVKSICSEAVYASVAKALDVSSTAMLAGELFVDTGSSQSVEVLSEHEYVEVHAHVLMDKSKGLNPAIARASVREGADYKVLYP